jgi:hypothetical protein
MQNPVKERIVKLREEKTQISEANRLHLQGGKKQIPGAAGITNVGFKDCRKSSDELARSLTGKNHEPTDAEPPESLTETTEELMASGSLKLRRQVEHLTYARFSELSSNHRTDLNVGGHHGGYPQ